MEIDIQKLSRLAHLSLSEEEEHLLSDQIRDIVAFASQIAADENPEKAFHSPLPPSKLREDIPASFPAAEKMLAQAPELSGNLIRIPAVMSEK